jgi:hypothetical protein
VDPFQIHVSARPAPVLCTNPPKRTALPVPVSDAQYVSTLVRAVVQLPQALHAKVRPVLVVYCCESHVPPCEVVQSWYVAPPAPQMLAAPHVVTGGVCWLQYPSRAPRADEQSLHDAQWNVWLSLVW